MTPAISDNAPQDNGPEHEMYRIMDKVLIELHDDTMNQRRTAFSMLLFNAQKAGVELLDWIKDFTFKNALQPIRSSLKPKPEFDREFYLAKMKVTMECYPDNPQRRQFHLKRSGYDHLINDSYKANVPLIEWLVSYYADRNPDLKPNVIPIEFKCPFCNTDFRSQNALNAHRVQQCRAKHQNVSNSHAERIN